MKPVLLAAAAALLVVLIVVGGTFFTVSQTQQALVLYFGEPVRVISKPGLKMKIPLIETVVRLDNRILDLDTPQQEVVAADNQRVLVDAFVRYRIADPLRFYQSVGTVLRANNQLASVMNSALRRVLGESTLPQIVKEDRGKLMVRIRDLVDADSTNLGLKIDDVRIRRADLPQQISEKVFSRMISERAREAAQYRAEGAEQSQTIKADADRQAVVLKADAQRKADEMRGQGDAERNRVFAEAYGKDPEFFAFYRSMQAYVTALKGSDTRLVLPPDSKFFHYFGDPTGGTAPTAP
ncbi:protease modulator HflC [Lichenihabitans sp. Uapishka_5]|uniref:protease modulator HflC n=1 Tax=Lichenihabitans sp. Uapishka_5 TaxID=3037302 RepID=UPI0029E7F004|nr:protease modulator HflC [Lichenihabitans sp. Uapishka_5]MDX7952908.1 protease modulator HflC [Lichenihabitans sp. Uapishka_5]